MAKKATKKMSPKKWENNKTNSGLITNKYAGETTKAQKLMPFVQNIRTKRWVWRGNAWTGSKRYQKFPDSRGKCMRIEDEAVRNVSFQGFRLGQSSKK